MTRARDDSEAAVSAAIRLDLGRDPDVVLWRNTTGEAVHVGEDGRKTRQRFGLAVGSADLIGIVRVAMWTLDGSGWPKDRVDIGRFLSLEVKRPESTTPEGRRRPCGTCAPEQLRWLACVRGRGGVAAVVRSVEDARAVVERAKRDPSWLGEGYDG